MITDLSLIPHHPAIEEITSVLSKKTQNADLPFFNVMAAYFLAKVASSMRAVVVTRDRGKIPINVYALSLATSGSGKGHSVNLLEGAYFKGFKDRFLNEALPIFAERNLWTLANARSLRKGSQPEDEHKGLEVEYTRAGPVAFTFDSGTAPAVKQLRQKLLLANCGSINLQIDEIGSNLIGATEVLNLFLELYDQGLVKQKLTKHTAENSRAEELDGCTPANLLLFGTPSKLLDGSKTEDEFYSFLETGYARRCIFAYGTRLRAGDVLTPEEIYQQLTDTSNEASIKRWADHFTGLADPAKIAWEINVDDNVAIELLRYRIACEHLADSYPEHEEIRKAEISHRYFKTLKLAGALAYVDESMDLSLDHLYQAMKVVEESGKAFERIFNREKTYVKLARFLANVNDDQTHADLTESLPFYKGSQSARNEMMNLATAWGYKNHVIIKKSFVEGIEFFKGEALKETNLEKMILSYGQHVAYNFRSQQVPFDRMHELTQLAGFHWFNHAIENGATGEGWRTEEKVIPGFNMVVIDVDKGTPLDVAKELLKDLTYLIYTTKSHSEDLHRYRIVLPINYQLAMSADEYKEFMKNIFAWLPFQVDEQTNQRARKWETFPGQHFYNQGELLDALRFIPKTSRNEDFRQSMVKLENLDNLERWFAQRMVEGNRNNHMLRFAMALVDSGLNYQQIEQRVLGFNSKLDNKLPEDELRGSVMVSVARKLQTAAAQP